MPVSLAVGDVRRIAHGPTRTLFPLWPQYHWPEIHGLLGMTIALLFGPKLLALILRLWSTRGARRFGGRLAVGEQAAGHRDHPAGAGEVAEGLEERVDVAQRGDVEAPHVLTAGQAGDQVVGHVGRERARDARLVVALAAGCTLWSARSACGPSSSATDDRKLERSRAVWNPTRS